MKRKDLPSLRLDPLSLGDWLNAARNQLKQHPEETVSSLFALISHVIKVPTHFGISHPEIQLSDQDRHQLDHLFERLLSGTPLPYLTGKQEFFNLVFVVTPDVLIPRPETELLVNLALDWLKAHPGKRQALDVGTGSGCIAVSVCANLPDVRFVAVDCSFNALQIANENIKNHQLTGQIPLVQMNLLSGISGRFDCLCANLPYVPTDRLAELDVSRHEPLLALDGGANGLDLIKKLLNQSVDLVSPGGVIFIEMDFSQTSEIVEIAAAYFPNSFVRIEKDLAGLPRVAVIELE